MHGAGLPQLDVKEEGTVRDDVSAWVCEMELQAYRLLPWKDLRVIHKEKGSNMQSSDIVKCGKLSEEQKALALLPHGVSRKVRRKANEERRSQLKAFADGDVKWISKEVLETTDVKVLETTGPPERKMPQARTSRAAEAAASSSRASGAASSWPASGASGAASSWSASSWRDGGWWRGGRR